VNFDGAKNAVIARARVQLEKIQAVLKDMNALTSLLLVRASLDFSGRTEQMIQAQEFCDRLHT
jgi:hypothetical protein